MFFRAFFRAHSGAQKLLKTVVPLSIVGCVVNWGIVQPLRGKSTTEHLKGSYPLLGANKGDPYYRDLSSIDWLNDLESAYEDLPPVSPRLTMEHAEFKEDKIGDFDPSLHATLKNVTQNVNYNENTQTILKDAFFFGKGNEKVMQLLSEIDTPYRSYFFNHQVRLLDKDHIVKDLIYSLAEESQHNGTSIRSESIKIDFQLEKIDTKDAHNFEEKYSIPLKANKLHGLKIQFKVYNPNNHVNWVFKSIPIKPYRETQVNLFLRKSEIRPILHPGTQTLKWGLFPQDGHQFEVSLEDFYPRFETHSFRLDRLSPVWGQSKWLTLRTIRHWENRPTYHDLYRLAEPYLVGITAEQIKKDIELWYGALAAWNSRLLIKDIDQLIYLTNAKTSVSKDGSMINAIEAILKEKDYREGLYNFLKVDLNTSSIANNILKNMSVDELTWFLYSISRGLNEMLQNTTITINWKEVPTLSPSTDDDTSPFPSVSFSFEHVTKWNEKIVIPFKGCWDPDKSTYEYKEQNECTGGKKFFDMSNKLEHLQFILDPIKDLIGSKVVWGMLSDESQASQFVSWDKFEIQKDEQVTTTYTAKDSPIVFFPHKVGDHWTNLSILPGWKALDVGISVDLSKFHRFFYKLYERLDKYQYSGSPTPDLKDTSNLNNLSTKLSAIVSDGTSAIPVAAHFINSLFERDQNTPEDKRPLFLFFKTLFTSPLQFNSLQATVGITTSMLDIEPWLDGLITNKDPYKLSTDWHSKDINKIKDYLESNWKFPVKAKNRKMQELLEETEFNYSYMFPRSPFIFNVSEFLGNNNWAQFLSKEGSTDHGLVSHKDVIKEILKRFLHEQKLAKASNIAPNVNQINWNKAKVNVTKFEVVKALQSILSLKLNIGFTVYAGMYYATNWKNFPNLTHLLGEMIQREPAIVTVNLFSEDNYLNMIRPNPLFTMSFWQSLVIPVGPRLEAKKMDPTFKEWLVALLSYAKVNVDL